VTDSGVLNCSIIIDGVEYTSEPYDLQVTGIVCVHMHCAVCHFSISIQRHCLWLPCIFPGQYLHYGQYHGNMVGPYL